MSHSAETLPPPPSRIPNPQPAEVMTVRVLNLRKSVGEVATGTLPGPNDYEILPMSKQYVDDATGQRHETGGPGRTFAGNHRTLTFHPTIEMYNSLASRDPSLRVPNIHISSMEELRIRDQLGEENRGKVHEAQLKLEPIPPLSMDPLTAERLKPNESERAPSVHDKSININGISHDRRRKDQDPRKTRLTIDDIRDYIVDRNNGAPVDPVKDAYLEKSQLIDKQKTSLGGKTMAHLLAMADDSTYPSQPGGLERLESEINKAFAEGTRATTDTGPDERIRLIAARKNAAGIFVDYSDTPLTNGEVEVRKKLLKIAHGNPAYFQACEGYELTKQQAHLTTRLWQDILTVQISELHYSDTEIAFSWHGMTYGRKYQDLTLKNSEIVHPIKIVKKQEEFIDSNGETKLRDALDQNGTPIWEELWEGVVDEETGDPVFERDELYDEFGEVADELIDGAELYNNLGEKVRDVSLPGGGRQKITDSDKPFALQIVYTTDTTGKKVPVFETDASGNDILVDRIDETTGLAVLDAQGNIVQDRVVKVEKIQKRVPVIDYHQVVIGEINTQNMAMEYATRFNPGQMVFETGEMQRQFEFVKELADKLDRSFYFPGFEEVGGIDALSKAGDLREPFGRESKEYLTSLLALSYMWIGVNNLRMNPDLGDPSKAGDASKDSAVAAALGHAMADRLAHASAIASGNVRNVSQQPMYPPKMHGASAAANAILEKMAGVLDSVVARHVKAMELRSADYSRGK